MTAGRGRPALPRRETTFQTNTCPRRYTRGRDEGVRPYHALSKVSTDIADLPAGAPCRRGEGAPPYRGGKQHSKQTLARGVIPAGGRGRPPLPVLPKVSTGIADSPAGAPCRRGEGAPPYRSEKLHFKQILGPRRLAVVRTRNALPRFNKRYICHYLTSFRPKR